MLLLLVLLATSAAQATTMGRWDWYRAGSAKNKTSVTSAPFGDASLSPLTTSDADMISNEPPRSPYFSDWNRLVSGYGSQRCYRIPREMKLCHNIGYDLMVLPNSLEHEAMEEVITQSEVWLTLVNLGCHDELERFLCSLYAPVCIRSYHEKLIQPCRELCESVRAACLPTMTNFGLGWPDIVKCSKFPQAPQELCIPPNKQRNETVILNPEARCFGCIDKPTYESAIGSFCSADVVIRAKVSDILPALSSDGQNTTQRVRINSRVTALKLPKSLNSPNNLDFQMDCDCPIIKAALTRTRGSGRWLMMGKLDRTGKTVMIQHLSQLSRHNTGTKRAVRDIRRSPNSLCKIDLTYPNPVTHWRAGGNRSGPSSAPTSQITSKQLSPQERRQRRQLRRRQNKSSFSLTQRHSAEMTLSNNPGELHHQPINDMPIMTTIPPPYYHYGQQQRQQQQRMGYVPYTH